MSDATPISAATTRDLSRYDVEPEYRGRSRLWQIAWLAVSTTLLMRWFCPNRVRIAVMRAFGATVGTGCIIRQRVRVNLPWKLTVGNNSWIGEGVWIINPEHVTIGSNVCLSQDAIICAGSHDANSVTLRRTSSPVTIHDGAWVALRATVLAGVTVGDHAVVGAGAIAAKDVPSRAIVVSRQSVITDRNS